MLAHPLMGPKVDMGRARKQRGERELPQQGVSIVTQAG